MSPRAFFIALIKVNPEAVSKNQNMKHHVIPNKEKMGKIFLKIQWVQILLEPTFSQYANQITLFGEISRPMRYFNTVANPFNYGLFALLLPTKVLIEGPGYMLFI
jgi:hypothetical protein